MVYLFGGGGFLIADVIASDKTAFGLELVHVPGTLDHVTVTHNRAGIGAVEAAAVSIIGSTVTNNATPIETEDAETIQLFLSFVSNGVLGKGFLSAGNNFIPPAGLIEVGTH